MPISRRAARVFALAGAAAAVILWGGGSASAAVCSTPNVYPGDDAARSSIAVWMARGARDRGIPGELPVMAALVESDLKDLSQGDSDTAGFFQMRVSIWNQGEYAGFPDDPELQLKWFVDRAIAVRDRAIAAGDTSYGADPSRWGEWAADVQTPAEQYRGRYQPELERARELIGELCTNPDPPAPPTPPAAPTVPTCRGRTATEVGTADRDVIVGSNSTDVIVALGGKDIVRTLGGDDIVCGGEGNDRLSGGAGGDHLLGQGGADTLRGGPGKDKLDGGPGQDTETQ